MKFLQTSDWHLGKTLYNTSLIEDQKYFINQVLSELQNDAYDALLIPGDIYDKAIPSVEGQVIFSDFLCKVKDINPELHIFILSGNHDSSKRLGFASPLLEKSNIHICSSVENFFKPVIIKDCAVYQLPFLTSGAFNSLTKETLKTQTELYKFAVNKILKEHKKNYSHLKSILCAHAYATGYDANIMTSTIGTAEIIEAKLFKGIDYTALGHIHKKQCLTPEKNVWFSGSPLAYTFDDTSKKVMLKVELTDSQTPAIQELEIKALHPLKRLEGTFDDFYHMEQTEIEKNNYQNCYIEFRVTDKKLIQNPVPLLKTKFPLTLSYVRKKVFVKEENSKLSERRILLNKKEISPEEIFNEFLKDIYGNELSNNYSDSDLKKIKTSFKELLSTKEDK